MELGELRNELKKSSPEKIVRKHILKDAAICFKGDMDLILELKESLSSYFDVHIKNIEIVGSAKLGVSLSEERFGKVYSQTSDIDLTIVSSELFDRAWHELLKLDYQYYKLSEKERKYLNDSYETIHRGFISPDRLPPKTDFYKMWWKLFNVLSSEDKYENRKIRGRLFKNWWFLEKYYTIQLIKLNRTQGG
ncbi:MAG: hypothetical protein JW976_13845 [Syntrophaceae bacterium]|nr:hypothetical protein [Syntrophaceae bacterium]